MITGKLKTTDRQYFEMPLDSYSTLKLFCTNRFKFYKKYVEKAPEYQLDEESDSINLGQMVDCLLTGTEEEFHQKFDFIECKRGGGQMWDFGDIVWKLTQLATNEEGEMTREFSDIAEEAFNAVKFDKKGKEVAFKGKTLEYALSEFEDSDVEILYEERRGKIGKTIVTAQEMQRAEEIVERLKTTDWTADILSKQSTKNFDVIYQLSCQFSIETLPIKSKLDIVHIDHINKTIQPYDLKVTHFISNFGYAYWIKSKYYIQDAVYHHAIHSFTAEKEDLQTYTILPMIFIVADPSNISMPVLWKSNYDNASIAMLGAEGKNGFRIRGVRELIREIQWAQETGNWTTPKEVVDNNGVLTIKPFEQVEKGEDD